MQHRLLFSTQALETLRLLNTTVPKKYKKVQKILGYMENNLRHPSLKSHDYKSLSGPKGEKMFEAYVENKTPGAWRIFWYYGPDKRVITIYTITSHP